MENVTHAVNWFEIPVADFERARKFYSAIFDYDMPASEMGGARLGFFPCDFAAGGIGGAINKSDRRHPSADGSLVYLNGGADLSVVLDRVEGAGGRVVVPKTQLSPEIGFIAIFEDSEGNRVGLHSRG